MQFPHLLEPRGDIMNYYYFFEGLSKSDVNKILSEIDKYMIGEKMEEGNINGIIDTSYRSSKIFWIPYLGFEWLYEMINKFIMMANNDLYKFLLCGTFERIQYTEYDETYEGHYDWHSDIGDGNTSFRKLSISIQLSDEYEGGELEFFLDREIVTVPKNIGDVIVFPSFITHRVQPVTKGIRKCLVIWASGPPFM